MDIKLEKKPWYIRYRYYLAGGILFKIIRSEEHTSELQSR